MHNNGYTWVQSRRQTSAACRNTVALARIKKGTSVFTHRRPHPISLAQDEQNPGLVIL